MGLIGLLVGIIVLIIIFVFSYLSNSSFFTPEKSEKIQNEAQEVMDSTTEKFKSEQDQIKNIDLR